MQWTIPVGLSGGAVAGAGNIPVAIYANLVSWWDFEENGAGTTFNDSHSTHNLTLINGKTTANDSAANGVVGRCANWPNSPSSDGAQIPRSDAAFDFGDVGFSFGGWFNIRQEIGADVARFLMGRGGSGAGGSNAASYAIEFQDLSPNNFDFMSVIVNANDTTAVTLVNNTSAPIPLNTPFFVVFGHDAANDLLINWVNGSRVETSFANGPFLNSICNFSFAQSRANDTLNTAPTRTYGHSTDSAFVANRCLSNAEVTYLYNAGAGFNYPTFANAAGH